MTAPHSALYDHGEFDFVYAAKVPELQPENFALPAARSAALQALHTDRALAAPQLLRHFGVHPGMLRGVHFSAPELLEPVHGRRLRVEAVFVTARPVVSRAPAPTLGHLAGAAELRLSLGIAPEEWSVVTQRNRYAPDAVFERSGRRYAVEYDRGTYTASRVVDKVIGYARDGYAAAIWAVPEAKRRRDGERHRAGRARRLRSLLATSPLLRQLHFPVMVHGVNWWDGLTPHE